jgi:membrane protease YdiL (CAAX protease family)
MYLMRRRETPAGARVRPGAVASVVSASAIGVVAGLVLHGLGFPDRHTAALVRLPWCGPALIAAGLLLCEELIFRGVLQRGLEEVLAARLAVRGRALPRWLVPLVAALIDTAVAVVAVGSTPGLPLAALLTMHAAGAAAWAVTKRTPASWLARVIILAIATTLTLTSAAP